MNLKNSFQAGLQTIRSAGRRFEENLDRFIFIAAIVLAVFHYTYTPFVESINETKGLGEAIGFVIVISLILAGSILILNFLYPIIRNIFWDIILSVKSVFLSPSTPFVALFFFVCSCILIDVGTRYEYAIFSLIGVVGCFYSFLWGMMISLE